MRPELKRDQKNPSLITLFLKRLSRAIFFKGTHVSHRSPAEINHFTGFSVICMKGKANWPCCLHRGASFTHKDVIKESRAEESFGSSRRRARWRWSTARGGISERRVHQSTAVKWWKEKKMNEGRCSKTCLEEEGNRETVKGL